MDTLYLSNWGSWRTVDQHGPGRRLCAMAEPREHELGDGSVPALHPSVQELARVRAGTMAWREYLVRYHVALSRRLRGGDLAPGALVVVDAYAFHRELVTLRPADGLVHVRDGDTLLCSCPRRGSSHWERPCHLEAAALYLARAGWRVVLYGRPLAADPSGPRTLAPARVRWQDTGHVFAGGLA